jgi:transcriptional regulator with XRE-family HTH domain
MIVWILRSEGYCGWTQERMARELDVSVSSVSKWETGAVEPMPKHRDRLSALAASVNFDKKDWPQKERKDLRAVDAHLGSASGD